jgi:urease accessory protein
MPLATKHVPAAERSGARVVDTLILNYTQRTSPRGFLFGVKGTCVELDFAEPVRLRTDDALLLDDGNLVEVVAEAEPLLEARIADPAALARTAWRLGDRHVPVEVKPKSLRVRRDPAAEKLLSDLGAKFSAIEAPFEPEDFAAAPDDGHHHHGHHHDHHHGDHHHGDHQHHGHDHGKKG